ncbi:hypothetical protein I5E72_02915 [Proteus terrae]|uniref:hypothetical protein n=1 Tax=Proteus terrae TaxID=1574161 RepID=UPI0018C7D98C|nr:hypothetical protein [Proteus terrae]MBG5948707.1 hypothetical protein [Proteus terrae]
MSVDNEQKKKELIEFFEKEKEKNNSNFLSKTRNVALSFMPGVKQVTQFRSDLIEYLDGNEVLRLVEFFYGINYKDNPDMLQALGPEYVEEIIESVMKDTEKDKLEYYINLTLNISNSDFDIKERREITRILKSLSVYDIELSKKYYIYNKFEISGYQNKNDKLIEISSSTDGFVLKSINNLAYNGLLYEATKGRAGQQFYSITDVMIKFLELIFKSNELLPSAINEIEKEKYDVLIVKERILQPMTNEYREDIEIKEFCDYFIGKFSSDDVRISSIYWDEWKKYEVTTRQFLFIIPDGDDFRIYSSSDVNTLYSFMKGESLNPMSCILLNKKDYLNTSLIEDIKENLEFIGKDKYI